MSFKGCPAVISVSLTLSVLSITVARKLQGKFRIIFPIALLFQALSYIQYTQINQCLVVSQAVPKTPSCSENPYCEIASVQCPFRHGTLISADRCS